ncbi:MAG: hypothetical protein HYX69_03625 [Planctomycetia bacterium]|nr:hypothetical protein [Planctomycetia bacterium]
MTSISSDHNVRRASVGSGAWSFEALPDWAQRPSGVAWREVAAVATDRQNRVYVFNRGDHPLLIFNPDGSFAQPWGEGRFVRPHGITIGPDDAVYCADDFNHTVRKFTPDGRLLMTLGTSGHPSDTGATSIDFRTIRRAAGPFHYPTNVALGPEGEIYVTDGYGNARVHKFAADGRLLFSWGEPGAAPGQFRVPHGIAVDGGGRVFVADRENSRIQIFSPDGKFLDQWIDVARPCQVVFDAEGNLLVAELGFRAGMWPGTAAPSPDATGGRVSVFDAVGKLVARWGGGDAPTEAGDFFAPHDICLDSRGDIYVAEVVASAAGDPSMAPRYHTLQKFVRRGSASIAP